MTFNIPTWLFFAAFGFLFYEWHGFFAVIVILGSIEFLIYAAIHTWAYIVREGLLEDEVPDKNEVKASQP